MAPRRCCAKDCFNSQMNVKDVCYFAFPKSEYYAHEWAVAAGRDDLIHKSLQSLVKYCLCSEHFTDDCFLDPPANTKLKKTIRPVKVPIPTIFKNNITKFAPGNLLANRQIAPSIDDNNLHEDLDLEPVEETTTILVIPESLAELAQQGLHNRTLNQNCEKDDNIDLTHCSNYGTIQESGFLADDVDQEAGKLVCRLCACEVAADQLIDIFSSYEIIQIVEFVLPGQVREDDEYSHLICNTCLEKASNCVEIMTEFREAQVLLTQTMSIH